MKLERRYESRQIAERVDAVAGAIDRDLRERPLVVVSILKGSAFFMADLTRKLRGPFSLRVPARPAGRGRAGRPPDRLHDAASRARTSTSSS